MSSQSGLKEQYRDASNLQSRVQLHDRFSTNPLGWYRWAFDRLQLPPRSRILELGCGDGGLWLKNAERIPAAWAITLSDFSPGMLRDVRNNLKAVERQFRYAVSDAQAIPFVDGHFDAVIANHMLYHVPDRPRALAEIRRVLRPGGRLFAATNGGRHMRELHEWIQAIVPDLPPVTERWTEAFSLESGREELSPFFSPVTLHS